MKVLILHQTVARHDAIGNDIEKMQEILTEEGKECYVYANNCLNPNIQYIDKANVKSLINDQENFLIYHHSVYWEEGEEILDMAVCKFTIRYHNITPGKFFQPYNRFHYRQCSLGREQTKRFQKKYPDCSWLCASEYNGEELSDVSKERIYICPPLHKIDEWKECIPDFKILNTLIDSEDINLLFVGRIAPNKGHLFLIEILRIYLLNYTRNIRLRIIGKFDDQIKCYNEKLINLIKCYRLEENVEFIGEVTDSTLMSYYLGSDIFICTSEHEGFCVPILEAQNFYLPIIALKACAVTDTCGEGAVLLDDDYREYAAAIHLLYENQRFIDYYARLGKDNYESKFCYSKLKEIFRGFCDEVIGG